jgi:hypothetical protein
MAQGHLLVTLREREHLGAGFVSVTEALDLGATVVLDLNRDGTVNVVDIQIVVNAVLHLGCSAQ